MLNQWCRVCFRSGRRRVRSGDIKKDLRGNGTKTGQAWTGELLEMKIQHGYTAKFLINRLSPAIPSWIFPRFPFQFLTHEIVLPIPWAMEAIPCVIHDTSVWRSMAMADSAQQF